MAAKNDLTEPTTDREIVCSRLFNEPREKVFQAFTDPNRLAQWWGPKDFTNVIHEFDFRPGGKWRLTMQAPNGAKFANESQFVEIVKHERIVFEHLEPVHHFKMTMTFAEHTGKTQLTWRMVFDTAEEVARIKSFILEANQQNFDRLEAQLAKMK